MPSRFYPFPIPLPAKLPQVVEHKKCLYWPRWWLVGRGRRPARFRWFPSRRGPCSWHESPRTAVAPAIRCTNCAPRCLPNLSKVKIVVRIGVGEEPSGINQGLSETDQPNSIPGAWIFFWYAQDFQGKFSTKLTWWFGIHLKSLGRKKKLGSSGSTVDCPHPQKRVVGAGGSFRQDKSNMYIWTQIWILWWWQQYKVPMGKFNVRRQTATRQARSKPDLDARRHFSMQCPRRQRPRGHWALLLTY